jgi:hypothetical protein
MVASIRPVELHPWELRFTLTRVIEDDGAEHWACTHFEIDGPAPVEGAEACEITAERMRHIADNFDRYRQMAENPGRYESIRRGMRRKRGEPWTPEALNLLVNDWRLLKALRAGACGHSRRCGALIAATFSAP